MCKCTICSPHREKKTNKHPKLKLKIHELKIKPEVRMGTQCKETHKLVAFCSRTPSCQWDDVGLSVFLLGTQYTIIQLL